MATSSCHAFASAPRAAPTGAATRAITARLAFAPNRRVASPIVPRATNDAANVIAAVDIPATNDEWEAVSPVDFAADATAALNADKVVILGKRGALRSPGFVASLPESLRGVWLEAVAAVQAGDNGGKRAIMVPWSDNNGRLKDVIVGVLPTGTSRHNCPAAPFAVDTVLAGVHPPKHGTTLGILAVLASAEDAMPIAVAVARHFPTYTAKSVRSPTGRCGTERGKIALKGAVALALVCASPTAPCETPDTDTVNRAVHTARAVRLAARVVDTPPAVMDPDALVGEAADVAMELMRSGADVAFDALRYDKLVANGFGGLVAVGDAAARDGREPALVHVKYRPTGAAPGSVRKVALVGKGVTFDTGGLQIKGKGGMPGMKTDLGGAAATLAAFKALVQCAPSHVELHLVLCIAENAVGPSAFRPDDVITPLSGRTVEINNTDAEGRIVLADGVAYASGTLGCDDVIDVATLTGAQMVATGRHFAGILSDDEEMERACVVAGRACGDLAHALPYAPEFFSKEFGSKVADMKNSVKDRSNAQSSCAGQFIANHLDAKWNKADPNPGADPEVPEGAERTRRRWLHVDMAGPSTDKAGRGTGYGVSLLVQLLNGELYTGAR